MSKVIASAAVSLDGFIADTDDAVGPLFDFYNNGPVEVYGTDKGRPFKVSEATAGYINSVWPTVGATVIGRHLFDLTNGWHGVPAVGEHVFVVTHEAPADWPFPDAPFTFVNGVEDAINQAKDFAGDRAVSLTAGNLTGQALAAGLVDEVVLNLVPVVFGTGIPFFGTYAGAQVLLDDPSVIQGTRVTHLHYRVR
ncbi:dihydrofolate reductase [Kribbella orskensis]|uniref:Dihydrofolate reductase n=1 Tax=Kribbella orskensis TaxID=2512216 RepID=A0ABY2BI87_9ACTN|nr:MULTISPECIES: dihydrofolate reductase [Kribbella]TCN38832.1 dihydrofolate reductase [Kribbella sp. VKM Ac-2500]TCO21013.1 dihydrofolate reductase [Kribbella orskensis]